MVGLLEAAHAVLGPHHWAVMALLELQLDQWLELLADHAPEREDTGGAAADDAEAADDLLDDLRTEAGVTFGSVGAALCAAWHSLLRIWQYQHSFGAELWEVVPELLRVLRAWGEPHASTFLAQAAWPTAGEEVDDDAAGRDEALAVAGARTLTLINPAVPSIVECATRGGALRRMLDETLAQTRVEYGGASADAAELDELSGWLRRWGQGVDVE
mmetsp:Transcript_18961/g.51382  ORF Transcript_18961/g.51382 Transcript_18961/m.51382 type:complete len:215 (+) Transcript_18961:65-709(+)